MLDIITVCLVQSTSNVSSRIHYSGKDGAVISSPGVRIIIFTPLLLY
jgi:hypothetical protein